MRAPALSFKNICLSFDRKPLFENLEFHAEGGLCSCILGPSGCGKSTLLKLVTGKSHLPFSGNIISSNKGDHRPQTAWMSQSDLLLPWKSVLDNVLLGSTLRGENSLVKKEKAITLLNEAGLGNVINAFPSALSGGMRQRVALLRTLMEERPVLLMDEPFSALDALTRIQLQNITSRLIRGTTTLLVTHDPMEALRMGDRVFVMAGSPVKLGASLDLPGLPPRDTGSPEIAVHYSKLLKRLMENKN